MLTVPEAAQRVGRNAETVRRWIREGRMPARKVGTQWILEEDDLADLAEEPEQLQGPRGHRRMADGSPMPNVVAWLHRSRSGH